MNEYQVPMIVTSETIRDFGFKKEDIMRRKIGNRSYRVVLVDASKELYEEYMKSNWLDIKRQDRESRCIIPGKRGPKRCPDKNRCSECPYTDYANREINKLSSLDVLVETANEPISEDVLEDNMVYKVLLDELIDMLEEIKPIYGKIFRGLYQGLSQQEMSEKLGMKPRTMSDYVQRIREQVKKFLK